MKRKDKQKLGLKDDNAYQRSEWRQMIKKANTTKREEESPKKKKNSVILK